MEITTPSGLRGEVRKLRGAEVNILSDRRAARSGKASDQLLAACWTKTLDAGPYPFISEGEDPPWDRLLVCDRFFTTVAIRIETYGAEFAFKARCGESGRGCGHQFTWEIDLRRDLPYYDLPEESRKVIAAGKNEFTAELDGRVVTFHLPTGRDEKLAIKRASKNKDAGMTSILAGRIDSIEGIGDRFRDIDKFLGEVDFDLQLDLLADMDAVDGGFDTKIEIECPRCDNVYEVDLPFGDAEFWTPRKSRERKTSRKKREAKTMAERE